jgi:acetate kinase
MKALILNSGSSSLKFAVFTVEGERELISGEIDWSKQPAQISMAWPERRPVSVELRLNGHAEAVARILEELRSGDAADIAAVGHRVVHGGDRYTSAVRITSEVEEAIHELAELAPLHNSASLHVIRAARRLLPRAQHIAAFDTSFHSTLPEAARTYPVPRQWTNDWRVRRYGFHGLSHAYCAERAAAMKPAQSGRLIIAHLGSGASVSAVRRGICIDTSMGFTPLDGLMMGSRSGAIDPGILIHVLLRKAMTADRLDHALNFESGLLGVSGVSSDMREVLAASATNPQAHLALEVYSHRLTQTIGAMVATLGGVDALVFTAGVGEHSPDIRRSVCDKLAFLGVELDPTANTNCSPDADVATAKSRVRILVIGTREDLMIVREIRKLISIRGQQKESIRDNIRDPTQARLRATHIRRRNRAPGAG